jgi:adenylyl-sulfate kinase
MKELGFTVWFTGLPFSGKKRLAGLLAAKLKSLGLSSQVLDGGKIRRRYAKKLGYKREDVYQNIQRICFECGMLTENGIAALAVTVSPYRELRQECRERIGRFVEVYCKCPLDILKQRDTKGLYRAAEEGRIHDLAGISAPFEEPEKPEVLFESDRETFEQGLAKTLSTLQLLGYIQPPPHKILTDEEEAMILQRLKDLGYL